MKEKAKARRRQSRKAREKRHEVRGRIAEALAYTGKELIVSGPAGTGKSFGILDRIHKLCEENPRVRVLLLRKVRVAVAESALVTFEEKVVPEGHPILQGPQRENRRVYRYPNGSVIVIGGMDKPRKLFSTEYDLIYWMECQEGTVEEWESLLRALRNGALPFQQLMGDCNPESPQHWIKLRVDEGRCLLVETRHEDNPVFWDAEKNDWTDAGREYVLGTLEQLTGVRYKRLRLGQWVAAEGQVYELFDAAIHVLVGFVPPKEWRRIRVVDFGYTNPFVCQWWAIDPDGRMYLYREIYRTKRLVRDHCQDIKLHSVGEVIEATIADHDAEDRATMEAEGIPTIPAYKAVSTGLEATQQRFKVAGDGKPRIFFCAGALVNRDDLLHNAKKPTNTLAELPGYVYAKTADGKPIKEEPVKQDDHGMDTTRYAVAYVDELGMGRTAEQDARRLQL